MALKKSLRHGTLALILLFCLGGFALALDGSDAVYYSDRFIFRGKDLNDAVLVLLNFNRGKEGPKYMGEFFGAIYYKGAWSFLEGNDPYPYAPKDLGVIQPSYYAKAEGSPISGFKLRYDGGDATFSISSGPTQPLYTSSAGSTLKSGVSLAEAVLTLRGKEYWGVLIHEPLLWKGFDYFGVKHKGLYREYESFYLTTEKGREIYLHQNKADLKAFRARYRLKETPPAEAGVIRSDPQPPTLFKSPLPIIPLEAIRPPLAFYTVPQRWKVEAPSVGTFYLWSRETASKNWFWGGYDLMAIEGLLKTGAREERVWGLAEYIP